MAMQTTMSWPTYDNVPWKTRNVFQCVAFIYNVKAQLAGCAQMLLAFSVMAVNNETWEPNTFNFERR